MSFNIDKNTIQKWAPLLVLLALCVVITALNPNFLSVRNFARIFTASAAPLMVAIGVTFIIIMGSIDLSMEGVVAFSGATLALLLSWFGGFENHGFWAIPLSILVGVAAGALTGFIHVRLKIPSFLASLGMGFTFIGLTMFLTDGARIHAKDSIFRMLLTERILGFPLMVYVAVFFLLVAWFIQRYTSLGRHFYAIGGGEDLAHASGVKVNKIRVLGFALAGAFFALGAMFAVARIGSVASNLGSGYMFISITSVVVGGTALTGGVGGVMQTLIGVLIVGVINNGMVLVGLPTYIQEGVLGLMVIVAVAMATSRRHLALVK